MRLITFDIGGTSADIGIVVDGQIAEMDARSASIAGFPLLLPMIDVHTIGAGGGSIAHVDHGGAFRVGPRSAGAVPGPAAYGRGGTEPTVTDANVVLGRLDPEDFLGGAMTLDPEASHRVVGALAAQLGLDLLATAEGILTVINSNMANAIRSRTVQKGVDPRQFALVAFGGAGPLHAADVAAMLGITEVIVPPFPGITSAMGLLTTDLKYDAIRTQFQVSTAVDLARLNADFAAMEAALRARFAADHVDDARIAFVRRGDLRYLGQGYELHIPFPAGEITAEAIAQVWQAFHAAHAAEYGQAFEASAIEIVNARVIGTGRIEKIAGQSKQRGGSLADAEVKVAQCLFRADGRLSSFDTTFYRRERLPVDAQIPAPAIVLQVDSTTVIPPGAHAVTDAAGNIIITPGVAP
jgi:N-methylhydantoinase A